MGERLRDGLRRVIFGRRGFDPRLAARYRWAGAFSFAVGFGIPVLFGGLKAGVGVLPLTVFSLMIGMPGGIAVGRWVVPEGGLRAS